jgi:hypothetical protein
MANSIEDVDYSFGYAIIFVEEIDPGHLIETTPAQMMLKSKEIGDV